jgi:hypothetical protein
VYGSSQCAKDWKGAQDETVVCRRDILGTKGPEQSETTGFTVVFVSISIVSDHHPRETGVNFHRHVERRSKSIYSTRVRYGRDLVFKQAKDEAEPNH